MITADEARKKVADKKAKDDAEREKVFIKAFFKRFDVKMKQAIDSKMCNFTIYNSEVIKNGFDNFIIPEKVLEEIKRKGYTLNIYTRQYGISNYIDVYWN